MSAKEVEEILYDGLAYVHAFHSQTTIYKFERFSELSEYLQKKIILMVDVSPQALRLVNSFFKDTIDLDGKQVFNFRSAWRFTRRYSMVYSFTDSCRSARACRNYTIKLARTHTVVKDSFNDLFLQALNVPLCVNDLRFNNVSALLEMYSDHVNFNRMFNMAVLKIPRLLTHNFFNNDPAVIRTICIKLSGIPLRTIRDAIGRGYIISDMYTIDRYLDSRDDNAICCHEWECILKVGSETMINRILKYYYDNDTDHYEKLLEWSEPANKKSRRKRKI